MTRRTFLSTGCTTLAMLVMAPMAWATAITIPRVPDQGPALTLDQGLGLAILEESGAGYIMDESGSESARPAIGTERSARV
jgi:hypothetical protein